MCIRDRLGAARGEDRGDDHVGCAEFLDQLGLGGAQGGDVQGQGPAAPVLDRVAQGGDEGGVAAHVVGPVVEHGDDRTVGAVTGRALQRPPGGAAAGASKPWPVSRTVSERKRASCSRLAGPPWAR